MKNIKRMLVMLLMLMMCIQCLPTAYASEGEVTATSVFDGFMGVPTDVDIPVTVTGAVPTKENVTVNGSFVSGLSVVAVDEATGSYKLSFDKKENTAYTVSVAGSEEISFKTSYNTDDAEQTTKASLDVSDWNASSVSLKVNFKGIRHDNVIKVIKPDNKSWGFAPACTDGSLKVHIYNARGIMGMTKTFDNMAMTSTADVLYVHFDSKDLYFTLVKSTGEVKTAYIAVSEWGSTDIFTDFVVAKVDVSATGQHPVYIGNGFSSADEDGYVEIDCTATSVVNKLPGVPVEAKIPLTLSQSVELKANNVKVTSGETTIENVTVEGSGTGYTLSFDKEYNTTYCVQVGTGNPITFTTAHNTNVASIPVNTSGDARNKVFGVHLSSMTLKISFTSAHGLPSNKYIYLYNDSEVISSISVTKENEKIRINAYRYDNGTQYGPASLISDVEFTDTVYVTFSDDVVYPFVLSQDGTVRYGTKWSYADKSIAGSTYNRMRIDSVVYGVSVGGVTADVPSSIEITNADSTGKADIKYTFGTQTTCKIICAVYDLDAENSVLLDADVLPVDGMYGTHTFSLDTKSKTNLMFKLFAINNLEQVTPLTRAFEFELNK